MASLARRIAPAAALGGLAVAIVGVADPVVAKLTRGEEAVVPEVTRPMATQQQAPTQPAPTQQDQPTGGSCANAEQAAGDAVMTEWGPVQVVATVDGTTLCAVQAVDWPQNDRKSQMINSYAIPELDAAASQVGTQFDYVSGATYTSEAYRQSLQSILDRR